MMKKSSFVDFHCHLDLYPDFEAAIAESEHHQIPTITVTTTPRAWPRNRDLAKKTKYVRPALGIHPQLVGEDSTDELSLWEKYLPEARYIGEVGIDASSRFSHTLNEQKRVFERILRCCEEAGGKILSIHSVRSVGLTLDLIGANTTRNRAGIVLHWFTGKFVEAQRAIGLGSYFSVNTQMLRTRGGRQLLEMIPLEKILTETDRPFTESGSEPSRRRDLEKLVRALAEIRNMETEAMTMRLLTNLKNLLASVGFIAT